MATNRRGFLGVVTALIGSLYLGAHQVLKRPESKTVMCDIDGLSSPLPISGHGHQLMEGKVCRGIPYDEWIYPDPGDDPFREFRLAWVKGPKGMETLEIDGKSNFMFSINCKGSVELASGRELLEKAFLAYWSQV